MIVKKIDFQHWVRFSQNIPDVNLNPDIASTQIEVINPILGDQLYNAIILIADTDPVAWDATTNYVIGNYATETVGDIPSYSDKVYRSIQAGTNQPFTNTAYWVLDPLATFWYNHVRPWAVFESFHRFLIWQGINVVQYSLVFMDTDQSTVIDGKTRSYILDNVEKSANIRKSKMLNYLKTVNWTIAGVEYSIDCTVYKKEKGSNRIRAVGRKGKYLDN